MMGLYARYIGPRVVSCLCSMPDIEAQRQKVVPRATGMVLEIGIGPGLNLHLYDPQQVSRVIGVDPAKSFLQLGRDRHRASPVPLEIIVAAAESLPLSNAFVDTAVLTYTLCSVEAPDLALREIRRVLKPSGKLLFLEHGLSTEPEVAAWQQRLNPVWRKFAVGCNLNRPIAALLEDAGFSIENVQHYYLHGTPRPLGFQCQGVAQAA